jgi:hypothetical protein
MGKSRGQEPIAVSEKKPFSIAEKKLDARPKLDVSKL